MKLLTDLIKAGIVDEQDAVDLKIKLKKSASAPGGLLSTLYIFFESKVFTRPTNGGFHLTMDPLANYDTTQPEADTTPYKKLLDILFSHQIIPAEVYKKLKPFPLPGNKNTYLGALYIASGLTAFYKNFSVEKQLEFAQILGGKNNYGADRMLHHLKKNKLTRDIKAGKLETYLDFFKYCYCCEFIDLATYQNKGPKLLQKLIKVINNLLYTSFSIIDITAQEDDFTGEPDYHTRQTTLIINTGDRQHSHTYTFGKGKNQAVYNLSLILENVLVLANKLLADYSCSYRFTAIADQLNEQLFPGSGEINAICRINIENKEFLDFYNMEARFLDNRPKPLFDRYPLSYTHIQYAIYHFEACGLLKHLPQTQLSDITSKLYLDTYKEPGDLMAVFPGTIAIVDQYITPGQKPYRRFLQDLNLISHGVLNFTDISDGLPDDFGHETVDDFNVSFTCGDKKHEVKCNVAYKDFDSTIIYYIITEIIRKDYPGYELIQFISSDHQHDYFLFASKQQNDYLQKMNLRAAIDRY